MRRYAAVLIIVATLWGCKKQGVTPTSDSGSQQSKVPFWDSKAINVAAFLVANDFDGLVEGRETLLKPSDLAPMAHVAIVTNAKDYETDFDSNEIAANRKYAEKKILVYGKVESTNEDAFGDGYFSLISSPFRSVQAHISKQSIDRAASIKRGDKVALVCDPGVRLIGFANLANCMFLSQYLAANHATPEEQVRGFFEGTAAITDDEFKEVMMSYAMAESPDIPTACVQSPGTTSCDPANWKLDKAAIKRMGDSVTNSLREMEPNNEKNFRRVSCNDPSVETPGDGSSCIMTRR